MRISNIQSFSLHDGPGFRTTVFLSGCPLRCLWCHNPETFSPKPTLIYEEGKCLGCGICAACERGVHIFEGAHTLRRELCIACGECTKKCPTGALLLSSRELTREEFISLVERQRRAFGERGGVTFSGGEPLMQGESILEYIEGVPSHYAIETSGYADGELFERVISRMDYVMLDIKLADPKMHEKYTGVSNEIILKNLEILKKSGKEHVIRTPLIPGITDTDENLSAIEKIVGDSPWETLEYNCLTPTKYERLGLEYSLSSCKYEQLDKNTVSSKNQLQSSHLVRFENPYGKGRRIMVVGNSITRHAPSASIGWRGDWGMAASSEGNDFVHLVESAVKKTDPDAAFCICQVAEWERDFARGESILPRLLAAREFDADLIVLRFVENVRHDSSFESRVFLSELDRLVKYLNKSQRAKIIVTTGFWHHPADSELRKYALWHSYPLVELGDLGEEEKYKAIGLFEHTGVANHPSDKGHAAIAERIVDAIKELK